ncbi:hypothetical protein FisN_28Lh073 [Fistulifera solaris]|uniref:Uncharacterized protein n=1 Tax=Fistulifera solaris TaxID=1519565 RepID=A0A1Z5K5B3_FISSO|nr:hypothetical protein FisN_28Lh073 [Fistulifera solaris]|eukprot:GAX21385.1 hypothetical protein FisN_28Lh073 [Fistulifera solaris]
MEEQRSYEEEELWEEPLIFIPHDLPSTARYKELQKELCGRNETRLFAFSRQIHNLAEIDWEMYLENDINPEIAIYFDNETFLRVSDDSRGKFVIKKRAFVFSIFLGGSTTNYLDCAVFGKTDFDILETATFFCSLTQPEHPKASLRFNHCLTDCKSSFPFIVDLAALRDDQLIQILETNSKKQVELEIGSWSLEQAKILTSRPFPLNLKLTRAREGWTGIGSKDDGTELINLLEKRQPRFGSFAVHCMEQGQMTMSHNNLARLMKLEGMFDKLTIGSLSGTSMFLPFTANAGMVEYDIDVRTFLPRDFNSVNIETKNLTLMFCAGHSNVSGEEMVSFLHRAAQSGHFECLGVATRRYRPNDAAPTVQALIQAIICNPKLTHLRLLGTSFLFTSGSHLQDIFRAITEHDSLHKVTLHPYPPLSGLDMEDDEYDRLCQPYYTALEGLLSRNRKLIILNDWGEKITNGTTIDELYLNNYVYTRWTKVVEEPTSVRPWLVGMALTNCASNSFQYTTQLLTFHTDMLCEMLDGMRFDVDTGDSRTTANQATDNASDNDE